MSSNPYAAAIEGQEVNIVFAKTPDWLTACVSELSVEQMDAAPSPGKWSVREILVHLADCEIAFGFRLRQVFGGERHIQPFDQDAWARGYKTYTAAQALETFRVLRAWNVAFVSGLTEADKQLPASHPERGEMTLWAVVELMAAHALHHVRLLEK